MSDASSLTAQAQSASYSSGTGMDYGLTDYGITACVADWSGGTCI